MDMDEVIKKNIEKRLSGRQTVRIIESMPDKIQDVQTEAGGHEAGEGTDERHDDGDGRDERTL